MVVLKPGPDCDGSIAVQNQDCSSARGDAPAALPVAQGRGGVPAELEKKRAGSSLGALGELWGPGKICGQLKGSGECWGDGPLGILGGAGGKAWGILGILGGF